MHAAIFDDRQLKIAVEGGGRYWMPFHASKPERDETAIVKVGPPPRCNRSGPCQLLSNCPAPIRQRPTVEPVKQNTRVERLQ